MIKLQLAHGGSLDDSIREATHLRSSPIMSLRAAAAVPLFALAQQTRDFAHIVSEGIGQLDALAMLTEQIANDDLDVMREYDRKRRPWADGADELIIGNIMVALFELAATDELDSLPIARWREDAVAHPNAHRIVALIDHICGLFVTATADGWGTVVNSASQDWACHAASALAATLLGRIGPRELLICHAMWVSYFERPHLHNLLASACEQQVTRQWTLASAAPALLVAPRNSGQWSASDAQLATTGWRRNQRQQCQLVEQMLSDLLDRLSAHCSTYFFDWKDASAQHFLLLRKRRRCEH
jgi:hypothetical protein